MNNNFSIVFLIVSLSFLLDIRLTVQFEFLLLLLELKFNALTENYKYKIWNIFKTIFAVNDNFKYHRQIKIRQLCLYKNQLENPKKKNWDVQNYILVDL